MNGFDYWNKVSIAGVVVEKYTRTDMSTKVVLQLDTQYIPIWFDIQGVDTNDIQVDDMISVFAYLGQTTDDGKVVVLAEEYTIVRKGDKNNE